ncbi:MAG: hypothetical protein PHN42_03955 [Bacilli bacterium]|nr:hypothetical protein [Bacilli bacterium]
MRQAIGSVPMYNIIMVFIVITFGFLSATLSYMKAFKVNGRIAKALENYEGYNILSNNEITETLSNIGYKIGDASSYSCPTRDNKAAVQAITGKNHVYCLYELDYYQNGTTKTRYFNYGIVSYIFIDLPIIGETIKVPVYSETEKIFRFSA